MSRRSSTNSNTTRRSRGRDGCATSAFLICPFVLEGDLTTLVAVRTGGRRGIEQATGAPAQSARQFTRDRAREQLLRADQPIRGARLLQAVHAPGDRAGTERAQGRRRQRAGQGGSCLRRPTIRRVQRAVGISLSLSLPPVSSPGHVQCT